MDLDSFTSSTEFSWEDNSYVFLKMLGSKTVEMQANSAGLRSLAEQLLKIANGDYNYVFYDTDPGDLEDGSICLQITKVKATGRSYP